MMLNYLYEEKDLLTMLSSLSNEDKIVYDSETIAFAKDNSINVHLDKIRLSQMLGFNSDDVYVIDVVKALDLGNYDLLQNIFVELLYKKRIVGHNMIFDSAIMLSNFGIPIVDLDDTLAMGKLIHCPIRTANSETGKIETDFSLSLKNLCKHYLDVDIDKEQQSSNWSKNLTRDQLVYAAMDVVYTKKLYEKMYPIIKEKKYTVEYEIERNAIPVTALCNVKGVYLDKNKIESLKLNTENQIKSLSDEINKYLSGGEDLFGSIPVNLDSPQQVVASLNKLKINVTSTNKEELEKFHNEHPVINTLIQYGSVSTLYDSFIKKYYENIDNQGYIYPKIGQFFTISGRKNSSDPINIMNVPKIKEFRNLFVALDGYSFIIADYNALETRIAASITKCQKMLDIFNLRTKLTKDSDEYEKRMADLHYVVASKLLNKSITSVTKDERNTYKTATYLFQYGGSIKKYIETIAKLSGVVKDFDQGKKDKHLWMDLFPEIKDWHENNTIEFGALNSSRTINHLHTITNRYMRFDSSKPFIATEALNYQIQPVAASGMKLAEKYVYSYLLEDALYDNFDTRIVMQIHDELVVQVKDDKIQYYSDIVKTSMETAMETVTRRILPMEVELHVSKEWSK